MTNGNDVTRYGITTEQVDALFARSNEQAAADREARQRAAAWPGEVEGLLVALTRRSASQANALAAIDAQLARLEASMGIAKG